MLWVPGNATRTTACSDATCGASSRGDLVAGGDELSGSAEPVVRGKNRHQGEGGSVRGSQRWRWNARRGRGRPGADEFVDGDRRVRRGEERRGGASGLLRSREMAGRVRMEWRSWWASWGSEGGPVAAVVASGGDGGSVRGGKQRGGRAFGEERGSSEGGRGARGHEA